MYSKVPGRNGKIVLKYPCKNLLCRLNKSGSCDAEYMVDLMCSALDLYSSCKERVIGEEILKTFKSLTGKKLLKDRKGNIKYGV